MEVTRCMVGYNIMASASSHGREIDPVMSAEMYDHAAGISCEFQRMVSVYGKESVNMLVHRVMRILLQLQELSLRCEKDSEEIADLRSKVEKLEAEKTERAQQKAKFDKEVEAYEDHWKSRVKDLVGDVERLQAENKRLRQTLQNEKQAIEEEASARYRETEEKEIKVITKLTETVNKQREELRARNRELAEKVVDCESLQADLDQVTKQNAELRHKNYTHKKQLRTLLEEKAELEVTLHQRDAELEKFKAVIAEREKFDQQKAAARAEQEMRKADAEAEDGGIEDEKSVAAETAAEEGDPNTSPALLGLDLEGKLIIDLKDPNRPRFTLHELRQVLLERNELKARLMELEEELQQYRPKEEDKEGDISDYLNYSGEEMAVYGPINKEPDEKMMGPRESGIRKLFSFFFGDGPSPSSSPQQKASVASKQ